MAIKCTVPRCPNAVDQVFHPFCDSCWDRVPSELKEKLLKSRYVSKQSEVKAIQEVAQLIMNPAST